MTNGVVANTLAPHRPCLRGRHRGGKEVKLFVKLPDWFTVPTPIGAYNPDWAILFERRDAFGEPKETLYLVRETKGTTDPEQRRGTENMRIDCARRHFATIEVDFRAVVDSLDLDVMG
jgi:type III restriction enzyme